LGLKGDITIESRQTGFDFTSPLGILYDGANLWVTVPSANVVRRVNPATGQVDQNIPVGLSPRFPVFDGTNLWVPCFASHQV
jgi:DNA-binding beta-propeller fold protein YncE